MRQTRFLIFLLFLSGLSGCRFFTAGTTERLFLSDVPVAGDQAVGSGWEFSCSAGRRSGEKAVIPVPSFWELEGFGTLQSGDAPGREAEVGQYRRAFRTPESWRGRRVRLVFEGVKTDAEVSLNGKSAGPKHQGGFYRFQYDVTDLLNETEKENVLEVTVNKVSSNPSVDVAERLPGSWILAGIYRPVYLEALPREAVEWVAIDAQADGNFSADLHLAGITTEAVVRGQVRTLKGRRVGDPFEAPVGTGAVKVLVKGRVAAPLRWTAETPNLYALDLTLERNGKLLHRFTQRFGFRTIELKPNDGFYLNGRKIRLKGVDRRCFEADPRRCLAPDAPRAEARFLKSLNLNAVRLADGPADPAFLDACDEVGLYVLDELAGYGGASYDLAVGRERVRELVTRDANHPSVLVWDNGGEQGANRALAGEFILFDRQRREVLAPGEFFAGVDATHLSTYPDLLEKTRHPVVFLPTGLLEGLPEAGAAAGLNDFWKTLCRASNGAGGFLSVADYPGLGGKESAPGGNRPHLGDGFSPDLAVSGPLGEGLNAMRAVWSPVQINARDLPSPFEGAFEVENRYDFLNLDQAVFEWRIVDWPGLVDGDDHAEEAAWVSGRVPGPNVAAGWQGALHLPIPEGWENHDALEVRALDAENREILAWSWTLRKPDSFPKALAGSVSGDPVAQEQGDALVVSVQDVAYRFDRREGQLLDVTVGGRTIPFGKGPRRIVLPIRNESEMTEVAGDAPLQHGPSEAGYGVKAGAIGGFDRVAWTVRRDGCLVLEYAGQAGATFDSLGLALDYGQTPVRRVRWLGDGPEGVWRNRMQGPRFGVHALSLEANGKSGADSTTATVPAGEAPGAPVAEHFFSRVRWAVLETSAGTIRVAPVGDPVFLGVGGTDPDPAKSQLLRANRVAFLSVIPAMSAPRHLPREMGPEGEAVKVRGKFQGQLLFCFEDTDRLKRAKGSAEEKRPSGWFRWKTADEKKAPSKGEEAGASKPDESVSPEKQPDAPAASPRAEGEDAGKSPGL